MNIDFLSIIICVACLAIVYVIVRIEKLHRTKLQCDYEKQLTDLRNLLDIAQSHSRVNELLIRRDTLRNELHNAKAQIYADTTVWSERERKVKDLYDQRIHYRSWAQFVPFVEQQFNGFLSHLRALSPELTEQQQLLSFLYLLNVDNDDIALIMNFQLSSLPNTKLRLAKKLNLTSGTLLQPTLESILV